MNIVEFYKELERHDWYYCWSDDSGVYRRGEADWNRLEGIAKAGGTSYVRLMTDFSKHMCSGPAWGTVKLPKPECPELTA